MEYFGYPVINGFRSQTPRGFYDPKKGHTGIDINCPTGTKLDLPIKTKVEIINKQTEMGLTLYLSDVKGNILVFSHLNKVNVKLGEEVGVGKVFAESGNTGTATTGPHLHFEIIAEKPEEGNEVMTRDLGGFEGYNIDPVPYLDAIINPHWSDESMAWMLEHEIITQVKDPNAPVLWGEFAVVSKRLTERILEWTNNPK